MATSAIRSPGVTKPHRDDAVRYLNREDDQLYRVGAPPPGFFRLFAIGELVGDKPARSGPAFWRLSDDVANVETGPGGR